MESGTTPRSHCGINLTLEIVGDKWTLLILRDMAFAGRRQFRELQSGSMEGIASNILADRLKRLVKEGILTRRDHPAHGLKAIYSFTEKGIALFPLLAQMAIWGLDYLDVAPEIAAVAAVLKEGGPKFWGELMNELRDRHLAKADDPDDRGSTGPAFAKLTRAYEAAARGKD